MVSALDDEQQSEQVPTNAIMRALGVLGGGTPVPATSEPSPAAPSSPPVTLPPSAAAGLSVLGGMPAVGGPRGTSPEPAATETEQPSAILSPAQREMWDKVKQFFGDAAKPYTPPDSGSPEAGAPVSALGTPSAPAAPAPPVASAPLPPPIPEAPPEPPPIPAAPAAEAPKVERPRGHAPNGSGLEPRTEYPPATDKLKIDQRYLVDLEKTDPALHDSIVQAATSAGISSGGLANLIYAVSQLPDKEKEGLTRTGLTKEDIEDYRKKFPDLPIGPDGKVDPALDLLLGAKKYRDMADKFGGEGTPSAIIANYLGDGRTQQLANMTSRKDQADIATPTAAKFVHNATGGPNAKPDAPMPPLNPTGTVTAESATRAAVASAQTGQPQIFATVVANGAPYGSTPTDAWRHTEALMVGARLARGDVVGAQHARELVFQMSHVGVVQSLMRGLQLMGSDGKGDLVGAAQQFAKAYWYMPDGWMSRIYVTDKGLVGERVNENTGIAVGGKFAITPQLVQGMLNQAQDPQTYLKTLRDSAKLAADVEKTHAETEEITKAKIPEAQAKTKLYEAQAGYQAQRADLETARSENAMEVKLMEIQRKLLTNPLDTKAREELTKHLDTEQPRYWPEKDISGAPIPPTEQSTKETQVWRDILSINRGVEQSRAALLAKGIVGGTIPIGRHASGGGAVLNKDGTATKVLLPPSTFDLIGRKPAAAPAR